MDRSFWKRVKDLCRAHKINQEDFAHYVDINIWTLKGWIYHNRIPDAISACDIADALGVSVEYLVRGVDGAAAARRMRQVKKQKVISARIKDLVTKLEQESQRLR